MKQSEFLRNIATLTPYQKQEMEMYVIDALRLNDEDKDMKPHYCPYCKKQSRMIKKRI